jgi:hypothetical protein
MGIFCSWVCVRYDFFVVSKKQAVKIPLQRRRSNGLFCLLLALSFLLIAVRKWKSADHDTNCALMIFPPRAGKTCTSQELLSSLRRHRV